MSTEKMEDNKNEVDVFAHNYAVVCSCTSEWIIKKVKEIETEEMTRNMEEYAKIVLSNLGSPINETLENCKARSESIRKYIANHKLKIDKTRYDFLPVELSSILFSEVAAQEFGALTDLVETDRSKYSATAVGLQIAPPEILQLRFQELIVSESRIEKSTSAGNGSPFLQELALRAGCSVVELRLNEQWVSTCHYAVINICAEDWVIKKMKEVETENIRLALKEYAKNILSSRRQVGETDEHFNARTIYRDEYHHSHKLIMDTTKYEFLPKEWSARIFNEKGATPPTVDQWKIFQHRFLDFLKCAVGVGSTGSSTSDYDEFMQFCCKLAKKAGFLDEAPADPVFQPRPQNLMEAIHGSTSAGVGSAEPIEEDLESIKSGSDSSFEILPTDDEIASKMAKLELENKNLAEQLLSTRSEIEQLQDQNCKLQAFACSKLELESQLKQAESRFEELMREYRMEIAERKELEERLQRAEGRLKEEFSERLNEAQKTFEEKLAFAEEYHEEERLEEQQKAAKKIEQLELKLVEFQTRDGKMMFERENEKKELAELMKKHQAEMLEVQMDNIRKTRAQKVWEAEKEEMKRTIEALKEDLADKMVKLKIDEEPVKKKELTKLLPWDDEPKVEENGAKPQFDMFPSVSPIYPTRSVPDPFAGFGPPPDSDPRYPSLNDQDPYWGRFNSQPDSNPRPIQESLKVQRHRERQIRFKQELESRSRNLELMRQQQEILRRMVRRHPVLGAHSGFLVPPQVLGEQEAEAEPASKKPKNLDEKPDDEQGSSSESPK